MHFPQKAIPEYQELSEHTSQSNHNAIILEKEAWAIRQVLISLALKYGADSQQLSA